MSADASLGQIVLIEDDPDIAALINDVLTDSGHKLEIRADLDGDPPDALVRLVITDLVAMRSYGRDVVRGWVAKVRERYPNAAVVVASAHGIAGGAASVGADALLAKPFDVRRLTETVESFLAP